MLERLRDRMIREEGYTLDEETRWLAPPGWIRDPDYVPRSRDGWSLEALRLFRGDARNRCLQKRLLRV